MKINRAFFPPVSRALLCTQTLSLTPRKLLGSSPGCPFRGEVPLLSSHPTTLTTPINENVTGTSSFLVLLYKGSTNLPTSSALLELPTSYYPHKTDAGPDREPRGTSCRSPRKLASPMTSRGTAHGHVSTFLSQFPRCSFLFSSCLHGRSRQPHFLALSSLGMVRSP